MPLWLLIVVAAHLLNAAAFLVDKFLLAKAVPKPSVYAFYVGVLSAIGIVFLAFDLRVPAAPLLLLDIAAGASFILALLLFFTALQRGEASRIVTYVGGTIPIWTLILAYLALHERLAPRELVAFGVLVAGSALISREAARVSTRRAHTFAIASLAAVAFAGSTVLMKAVFTTQPFLSGFAWSRVGAVLAALAILLHASSRTAILQRERRPRGSALTLFLAGQVAGSIGFLALQVAVSLASPSLVNALQGVQYAFLFFFIVLLGRRLPQLREHLTRSIIFQKVVAILVITAGLALLAWR